MKSRNRRKVGNGRVCLGIALIAGVLCCGCRQADITRITGTDTAMGTIIRMDLYVAEQSGENDERDYRGEIMELIRALEAEELSWRIETSQTAEINKAAGKEEGAAVSTRVGEYLQQILELSEQSEGALDVTVGIISRLWDIDTWALEQREEDVSFEPPSREDISQALQYTGYQAVRLEEDRVYLPQGMSIDMGAVGKGITCDRIAEYLCTDDCIRGAVISVGGSIVTWGAKPDDSPWRVAIAHPRENGEYLGILTLRGERYVSTSGDYERYVEQNGVRYHHIMDPSTGYPADSGLSSVTIISDSGLLSDALSTACFVLGADRGMALAETYGADALFVGADGTLYMTEHMKEIFAPQ